MIKMEEWTTIRCLKNKGYSIRKIAKILNKSRNTIKKAINDHQGPKYNIKIPRISSLEAFKEQIETMIYKHNFIGSRILEEIKKIGYKGSSSAFYNYLKTINGAKNTNKISKPYNTAPGKQAQFDWSEYSIEINGKTRTIYIFNLILSYSRKKKFIASLSQDQASVLEAIEEALKYFGGTTEEILVDNASQLVDYHHNSDISWNRAFFNLCGFYGITARACKVRTPKTKGKVENPFYYLEQHFIKGQSFKSFEELEHKLERFNEHFNNMVHGVTKKRANDMFIIEELSSLKKLPQSDFSSSLMENRKVNWDSLFSYNANKYSVPHLYAGKEIWVKNIKGYYLKIYSPSGKHITTHKVSDKKNDIVIVDEHYSGIKTDTPKTKTILQNEFMKYYSANSLFLKYLYEQRTHSAIRDLRAIINLRNYYNDIEIDNALKTDRKSVV